MKSAEVKTESSEIILKSSIETIEVELEEHPTLDNKLKELKHLMHDARNTCEHSGDKHICSPLYCFEIHNIEKYGKGVFNSDFPLDDYSFYFFDSLKETRRVCFGGCSLSRANFRIAEHYLNNLIKSLC